MKLTLEDLDINRKMFTASIWWAQECRGDEKKTEVMESLIGVSPKKFIQRVQQFRDKFDASEEMLSVNSGNNQKVLEYISTRLESGNDKFGKEIPLDGTYTKKDALEEAVDLSIYLASMLLGDSD
jgi:hypothetical protein